MANLKSLLVTGVSRFVGDIIGSRFVIDGGTSSQFLKADGSVDTNTYITSSGSVASATKATNDGSNRNIVNTYAIKSTMDEATETLTID